LEAKYLVTACRLTVYDHWLDFSATLYGREVFQGDILSNLLLCEHIWQAHPKRHSTVTHRMPRTLFGGVRYRPPCHIIKEGDGSHL